MMERKILDKGGILDYDATFLSKEEADKLFDFLKQNVSWEQIFYTNYKTGIKYTQPRLTAWYADNSDIEYTYSGITQIVQPWLPELLLLKKKVESVSGVEYNSALLNFYRNGSDSIGLHADNEKELGVNPNIASISLGVTRTFQLIKSTDTVEYELTNGSLLIMSGTTQQYWKHTIPKAHSIKDGRINLTFRKIIL